MSGAAICIGYGARGSHEAALFAFCQERWQQHFPEWPIYVGDGGIPYNRAAARNHAAAQALTVGADVLVFADADTIFLSPQGVADSVEHASQGGWTLTACYYMVGRAFTNRTLRWRTLQSPRGPEIDRHLEQSPAGLQIMSTDAFAQVRGWDEHFTGWGWEDAAMRDALDTIVSPHIRLATVVHLWHPRPRHLTPRHPDSQASRARWRTLYAPARGDRTAMQGVIRDK